MGKEPGGGGSRRGQMGKNRWEWENRKSQRRAVAVRRERTLEDGRMGRAKGEQW